MPRSGATVHHAQAVHCDKKEDESRYFAPAASAYRRMTMGRMTWAGSVTASASRRVTI